MDYLNLIGSVGEEQENDPADIKNTAASLTDLGVGRMNRAAETGVWDGDFDRGVRSYQADSGLDVDGVLLPGGPTQRAINNSLGLAEEPYGKMPTPWRMGSSSARQPAALTVARSAPPRDENDLERAPLLTREDRMSARGYRYRPDPMGRLSEGDWLDALGRPATDAELREFERETVSPARPATANIFDTLTSSSNWPPASQAGSPSQVTSLVEGGNAFGRELLRVTKLGDFDDPSVYLEAVEEIGEEHEGVEPAGFRDDLRKLLAAMRRHPALLPKAPPGPPRPPAGHAPLPTAVTERLDQIREPLTRNAASRLLDGAVVKGWKPNTGDFAAPTEVVKQGGQAAAFKDFAQFIGRAGGTKHDIKIHKPGVYGYEMPDNLRITFYTSEKGATNAIVIELPPALRSSARGKNTSIKIRYE